jgi:microcystin-dependent protein
MALKILNSVFATLGANINNAVAAIPLTAGQGARFGAFGAGDYAYATLVNSSNVLEIVKITAIVGDSLTVLRGQDGTAAQAYSAGDRIECRPCNAAIKAAMQEASLANSAAMATADGGLTYTGNLLIAPVAYNTQQLYGGTFGTPSSSTTPSVNFNGLGAVTVVRPNGAACLIGDLSGEHIFRYNGANMVVLNPANMPAEDIGSVKWWPYWKLPNALWDWADGNTVSRAGFPAFTAASMTSAVVAISINNPGVVTWNNHGLRDNLPVRFFTTGALPTGITAGTHGGPTAGTIYYVKKIDANSFNIATTPGGAAIVTTGVQNGVHTAVVAPNGDGDGATTVHKVDMRGRTPVGRDDQGAAGAANRLTSGGSGILGNVVGASAGAETVALSTANLAVHAHGVNDSGHAHNQQIQGSPGSPITPIAAATSSNSLTNAAATTDSQLSNITIQNNGSGTAHLNLQPCIVGDFIVRLQ